jgi:hypothetical protein
MVGRNDLGEQKNDVTVTSHSIFHIIKEDVMPYRWTQGGGGG